jgi:helix-turn-helix protein
MKYLKLFESFKTIKKASLNELIRWCDNHTIVKITEEDIHKLIGILRQSSNIDFLRSIGFTLSLDDNSFHVETPANSGPSILAETHFERCKFYIHKYSDEWWTISVREYPKVYKDIDGDWIIDGDDGLKKFFDELEDENDEDLFFL